MVAEFKDLDEIQAFWTSVNFPVVFGASDSWCGETIAQTKERMLRGNTDLVPLARKLYNDLNLKIPTKKLDWKPSVAGPRISVPDFVNNLPENARRVYETPQENAPITIVAHIASSGMLSAEYLAKRGITLLALSMALAVVRPVKLKTLDVGGKRGYGSSNQDIFLTCEIPCSPINLSVACWMLTSAAFARRICYGIEQELMGFDGSWASDYSNKRCLELLNLREETSLIIEAPHANEPMVLQPVKWINEQIAKFINLVEDDAA